MSYSKSIDPLQFGDGDSLTKYLGGVLKSMLTLNEAIIDVKEG